METKQLKLERRGQVHLLTLHGGENQICAALLTDLDRALTEVEHFEGPTALVTTGRERFFSTGYLVHELQDPSGASQLVQASLDVCARLLSLDVPCVAAVNGHAFGIGGMLALSHDYRLMRAERGYLCMPELELGLRLHPAMFALVGSRARGRVMRDLFLRGKRMTGQDALAAELVDGLYQEQDLVTEALGLAGSLLGRSRPLYADYKRSLNAAALEAIARGRSFSYPPMPVEEPSKD